MSVPTTSTQPAVTTGPVSPPMRDYSAAVLSYLIPGLGQIVQGRVAKGMLFLVGVYGLFFYGMSLGQWSNVYYADSTTSAQKDWKMWRDQPVPRWLINLYNRPQFAGQFWIGMAAWPAIRHYVVDDPLWLHDYKHQRTSEEDKGPQSQKEYDELILGKINQMSAWQRFEVALPESRINDLQRDADKHWDLGWVYTVIAGVLNILVMYDAFGGPAFTGRPEQEAKK